MQLGVARIKRAGASDVRRVQALQSWDFIGEHPTEFDYGIDERPSGSGHRAALIRYSRPTLSRYRDTARIFGSLGQTVSAVPYHGKRLEISVELATEGVSHGATVWVRVDKSPGHILAFDNLKGSPDGGWLFGDNRKTKRRIVIEVSPEGASLQFGFFLKGTGSVWAADFTLTVMDKTQPLTGEPYDRPAITSGWIAPENLDFSKVVVWFLERGKASGD